MYMLNYHAHFPLFLLSNDSKIEEKEEKALLISLIQQHFPEIEALFSEKSMDEFLSCAFENLYFYHFGLGTYIRNSLLKEGGGLLELFLQCGLHEKDEMSHLIIELFYLHEKTNKRKPAKICRFSKENTL